jgi:hypothetical protein
MNSRLLNTFVVLLLIGSIAATKFTTSKLDKIKSQKFAKSALGKTIVDTVQIQMKTGGSVDTVVRLLESLYDSLESQQEDADEDSL